MKNFFKNLKIKNKNLIKFHKNLKKTKLILFLKKFKKKKKKNFLRYFVVLSFTLYLTK